MVRMAYTPNVVISRSKEARHPGTHQPHEGRGGTLAPLSKGSFLPKDPIGSSLTSLRNSRLCHPRRHVPFAETYPPRRARSRSEWTIKRIAIGVCPRRTV